MFCKNIEAHLAMQKLVSIMKSVPFTEKHGGFKHSILFGYKCFEVCTYLCLTDK